MATVISKKTSKSYRIKDSRWLLIPKKEYSDLFGITDEDFFEKTICDDGTIIIRPLRPVQMQR